MDIDLVINFKVLLTPYVVVAFQLNQPHAFSCTAIISPQFAQLC